MGEQGVWETEVPQRAQEQSPGGGLGAKHCVQCNIVPIKLVSVHHLFVFHC